MGVSLFFITAYIEKNYNPEANFVSKGNVLKIHHFFKEGIQYPLKVRGYYMSD